MRLTKFLSFLLLVLAVFLPTTSVAAQGTIGPVSSITAPTAILPAAEVLTPVSITATALANFASPIDSTPTVTFAYRHRPPSTGYRSETLKRNHARVRNRLRLRTNL